MEGRVIKIISNQFTVKTNENKYLCSASGNLRKLRHSPVVGDFVIFDESKKFIKSILPRKNSLVRPPVSNIDNALIVTSVCIPDFSSNLLDKLICIIEYNNIKPIICFTKMDKLDNEKKQEIRDIMDYYKKIGYKVFENTQIDKLKEELKGKVTVLTGQTGAGKSTLLNKIDNQLNLQTGEVSIALGRGKHTTRHVELLETCGGLIADTPGFSSLEFYDMTKESVRDNFIEFNEYREKCKYKDCMHDMENDCEIKTMVNEQKILNSRYENYLNFIKKV